MSGDMKIPSHPGHQFFNQEGIKRLVQDQLAHTHIHPRLSIKIATNGGIRPAAIKLSKIVIVGLSFKYPQPSSRISKV